MVGAAALTPLLAWLGPLGFAPLLGLVGLLSLPALRVEPDLRPLAWLLVGFLAWTLFSSLWSPHQSGGAEDSTALKLALQLPLYAAAWCAARRTEPGLARLALRVLLLGLAAYAALLLVEAFSGIAVYRAVRQALHDPIEFQYARKNVAQGTFVLALLWPVAGLGSGRGALAWLAVPIAGAVAVAAHVLLADAPVLAVGVAVAAVGVVLAWPMGGPKTLGALVAALVLLMPPLELSLRASGIAARLPLSWAERVAYWDYAVDRIMERPWAGWGLDASRDFSPHIQLHPHNGALQVWLELGAVGAALAALLWAVFFRGLAGERRSLAHAGAAGSLAVYLLFGLVSFGAWQEWWLALGALVAVVHALQRRAAAQA
jgi:O-antigen ligase